MMGDVRSNSQVFKVGVSREALINGTNRLGFFPLLSLRRIICLFGFFGTHLLKQISVILSQEQCSRCTQQTAYRHVGTQPIPNHRTPSENAHKSFFVRVYPAWSICPDVGAGANHQKYHYQQTLEIE